MQANGRPVPMNCDPRQTLSQPPMACAPVQAPSMLPMNYAQGQPLSLLPTPGADRPLTVCGRPGDKFEISGCDTVNIINQSIKSQAGPTGTLPNFMKQYEEDFQNLFVPTAPFPACGNTLREHHVLMITGAPGSGKTMIAQQLMVKLCIWDVNKCHPFRVTKPSEYTKNHNPEILQVFHIDDVFGSSNFVQGKYDAWKPVFTNMRDDLRSNNTFIIFTSRDNILNANLNDLNNYEVFWHVINVSDKEFELTEKNKEDIFENHAEASQLDIEYNDIVDHTQVKDASGQTTQDAIGYPQRVRLLCAMKGVTMESRIRFFLRPMEFLSKIIGSYRENDHLSYCILILILMNDGKLPVSYLHPSNKSSKLVQTWMEICLLPSNTAMGELRATAENLRGSFIILIDGFFVFQHESIMEAATLDIGKLYPSDILDRCSMQFLLERVFTKDSAPPENDYVVTLQSDTYDELCVRLVKEIARCVCVEGKSSSDKGDPGSLSSLSAYRVFTDTDFFHLFLHHMQKIDSFHLLITSSSPDSQHPTFLFFAAASGQDALIQEILSSYLRDLQQLPGFSDHLDHVLYAACSGGSPATVRKLLETGARTDYRTARQPNQVSYALGWKKPFTCTTLMHAAYSGNTEVLRLIIDHLLRHQVDVAEHINIRDGYWRRTALHWWADRGRDAASVLQILLKTGADLHARDKDGRTALHVNARRGDEASIHALVKAGANVNDGDKYGYTALHWSAQRSDKASIRVLVEAEANVNVRDKDGQTALHWCAQRGSEASINALVEAGADVNVGDKDGWTALHWSAQRGDEASIRALVKTMADVNVGDKDGQTALHLSGWRGDEASIQALMEAGANVNVGDKIGRTALHQSALQGHEASIRALVEAGADVNVGDKDGRTALQLSARRGYEASIRMLVEARADVNVGDTDGLTALHVSALLGHEAFIHGLVKAGAIVNMRDKVGQTALHLSAQQGGEASIHALVEAEIDVNVGDKDGRTALHLSAMWGHEASIRALVEARADVNVADKDCWTALNLSAQRGHEASIRALVEARADVNVADKDCRTALHQSALHGHEASIRALVEAGANVNVRDKDGRTALHLSARCGHRASIRMLVETGADVNVAGMDGQTALHLSARRGIEPSIRALVEAGVNVNVGEKDGWTALHYAVQMGHTDIVRLLVEAGANVHLKASSSRLRPYTDLTPLEVADLCGCTAVADYLSSLTSE